MFAPRFRRDFDPVELLASFPPELVHPHKRLVFELACPRGSERAPPITPW